MLAWSTVATAVTRKLPKVISPRGHAVADYCLVGIFLGAAGVFWKKNRSAAVAALICGGAELALNLATDYPGGVADVIGFPAHGKFDLALAGLTATMPKLFVLSEGRTFFLTQAGLMTAATNATNFKSTKRNPLA